jgi:hypothetical protein
MTVGRWVWAGSERSGGQGGGGGGYGGSGGYELAVARERSCTSIGRRENLEREA